MAHPFISAVLSMGPLMIYADCCLMGPCGFTDAIGLFTLYLGRGPTQGVRQLSMSSTMGPLYTIDNSSQQCQLAHSFILAVLSMGPLMIFAHCCLMGLCGSIDMIGLFTLCLDRGPTRDVRQLLMSSTMGPL